MRVVGQSATRSTKPFHGAPPATDDPMASAVGTMIAAAAWVVTAAGHDRGLVAGGERGGEPERLADIARARQLAIVLDDAAALE